MDGDATRMNKTHWYDGWFYDRWIAPNQDILFGQIRSLIQPRTRIIDVGCGTGRLAFSLAHISERVVGIDLSMRNIQRARANLSKNPHPGISFEHKGVRDILADQNEHFDYAVLTYVLHEVAEHERTPLLYDVSLIADKIIIGDYLVPTASGWRSYLNKMIEYAAGMDHYTNFKSFVAGGGVRGLVGRMSLEVLEEFTDRPRTSHLVLLRSNEAGSVAHEESSQTWHAADAGLFRA
jgi:SAM-dependent methyltransferase